jgi:predicted SpoU family rRNA methylase
MKASDREAQALYESLAGIVGPDAAGDFKVELDILLRRYLREYTQRVTDAEVAKLLPEGWRVVVERFGGSKSLAYKRNKRHRQRSRVTESTLNEIR